MLRRPSLLFALLLVGIVRAQETAVTLQLEQIATGLTRICDISHCGDDRLFLTLQAGVIKIMDASNTVLPTPFLDITDRVQSTENEQGLLGLTFDPDYLTNGFFYVDYVTGSGSGTTRISRFSVTADPNVADPNSEQILYTRAQPFWNHNGGDLAFGPDGYLYVGFGDGGSGGDPNNNAQNMNIALGKLIRIDVSGPTGWSVPPDNPFATATDTLPEIFANGLRNPWRWSFDAVTGDLWIGDVGQDAVEEVDFWPAGDLTGPNFGWRCYEANNAYNTAGCLPAASYVAPVAAHPQSQQNWCSVIGGRVYRGPTYWRVEGRYIYTDYCGGQFYTLERNDLGAWVRTQVLGNGGFGFSCIGENNSLEMYAGNNSNGRLYKIKEVCTAQRPTISANAGVITSTTATAYQWYRSGTVVSGETGQAITPTVEGNYYVLATVNTGCQLFSDTLWYSPVGVEEVEGVSYVVRPIPADDRIWIDGALPAGAVMRLIDASGRVVIEKRAGNSATFSIGLEGVVEGVYILRATRVDGSAILQRSVTIAR
ncbi:MAG: PQQ-dependent sugar dehydrogenase [Flavobacteriales bacterium]|nr:PQQ-dependent sugar dehydrogenase [Flavobacteriales bacterium]MCC6937599.1 PQQ-dependent sugar dehydrogenase [Flavobacteriales bacterium]